MWGETQNFSKSQSHMGYMGKEHGIFLCPMASILGGSSEFFEVPQPAWGCQIQYIDILLFIFHVFLHIFDIFLHISTNEDI